MDIKLILNKLVVGLYLFYQHQWSIYFSSLDLNKAAAAVWGIYSKKRYNSVLDGQEHVPWDIIDEMDSLRYYQW